MQADYTRYASTHLAASLTLPLGTRPGAGIMTRLPAYLRPKCAPILLDPALMSPATLRLNVYQVGPEDKRPCTMNSCKAACYPNDGDTRSVSASRQPLSH